MDIGTASNEDSRTPTGVEELGPDPLREVQGSGSVGVLRGPSRGAPAGLGSAVGWAVVELANDCSGAVGNAASEIAATFGERCWK